MLCTCVDVFGHIQVQLGQVTAVGVMHIQNSKWPPAKLQVFKFMSQIFTIIDGIYHKYCWNMLSPCQIEDYTPITPNKEDQLCQVLTACRRSRFLLTNTVPN